MNWTRVEDGVPNVGTLALLWNGHYYMVGYTENFSFGLHWYESENEIYGITHWMPLPKPPK